MSFYSFRTRPARRVDVNVKFSGLITVREAPLHYLAHQNLRTRTESILHRNGYSNIMNGASRILPIIVLCVCFFSSGMAYSDLVKMSNNSLCHPPQSSWYERTENFTTFESLGACLDNGGRLPKRMSLASRSRSQDQTSGQDDYDRSAFGHGWVDQDSDCQNSRAEALIATSTTRIRFADERRCRAKTGRWTSPFTNKVMQNASDIDIDHVVPLKWAWNRGAKQWFEDKRQQFANDKINLWPVETSLNRSKGARSPDQWLPPAGQCGYVARFTRIVKLYGLKPKTTETEWMKSFLDDCWN